MKLIRRKNKEPGHLITEYNLNGAFAESYRILRTNLGFAGLGKDYHSIMVSSPCSEDGKSTIIANLAVVMAQTGNKVLLVDGDLRKPVLHKFFNVDNQHGLTNCLIQQMDIEEASYQDLMDNLTLLTSGPISFNPADILGSEHARDFWKQNADRYDYLFIDSPPVLTATDALVMSASVEGVILAVRSSVTHNNLARQARDQLIRANARILGVVMNQVKKDANGYYNYCYY